MKKYITRVVALLVAMTLIGTLLTSCTGDSGNSAQESSKQEASNKTETSKAESVTETSKAESVPIVEDESTTFSLVFGEHETELYHPDSWVLPKKIQEKFNITLDITAVPSADWATKRSTIIASADIPDLMMGVPRSDANTFGAQGLFLNLYDYIDYLPDMLTCMEKFPTLKTWMYYSDSEIYSLAAQIATEGLISQAAWYIPFIREDVLNKLNITEIPTTFEGLHDLFVKLKEAYPDSYPWINRQKFKFILTVFAPGLGINVAPQSSAGTEYAVWNEDKQQFTSIMEEENFKWFLSWMNQLYNEGLLDPNYAVDDSTTWQDKLVNSEGFFALDYYARPSTMSAAGREVDPDFTLEPIMPPALDGMDAKIYAQTGIKAGNAFGAGCKNPERLAELLNWWFFTEEGCLVSTQGFEGETYTKNADGTISRIFTDEAPTTLDFDAVYGVQYPAFYSFYPDFWGYNMRDANQDPIWLRCWDFYEDKLTDLPPTVYLGPDEQSEYDEYSVDLSTTLENVFNEFVIGRRNINTDWDAAIEELNLAGYQDFLDLMNRVYSGN